VIDTLLKVRDPYSQELMKTVFLYLASRAADARYGTMSRLLLAQIVRYDS
jgi:hypothetical protein